MNAYSRRIRELLASVSPELIGERPAAPPPIRVPTQAFSDFLINREMGDWAEGLVLRAIERSGLGLSAVPYGRTENLVAGEPGFRDYYLAYRAELYSLGKRPDLLVYRGPPPDFGERNGEALIPLASRALAGVEVRSSQQSLNGTRPPSELSFTPKVEDIWNVARWIERHGVPHYYVQVLFGAVYGISFEAILEHLAMGPKEGGFTVDKQPKNQFKSTIYLPLDKGTCLTTAFGWPKLAAFSRQLASGRMLFGVHFSGGEAVFDACTLSGLIRLDGTE